MDLGNAHEDEAFPPELGRMKYLRVLVLSHCGLGTVPVFVGELKSLEILDLSYNDLQNDAPLDFLIKGCPRLRQIWLRERPGAPPRTPALLAHLEAFKAKLLAQNPDAEVIY
jgi:Leucine Rich repeats (2 copies)